MNLPLEGIKKCLFITVFCVSVIFGIGFATRTMAQISAPAIPDTTNLEQYGQDSLSKLLNVAGSFSGIKSSLQTVEKSVGQGTGVVTTIQKYWVDANRWFEEKVGFSLRTIVQFIGYIFIFVAVLWIKLIRWFLGII